MDDGRISNILGITDYCLFSFLTLTKSLISVLSPKYPHLLSFSSNGPLKAFVIVFRFINVLDRPERLLLIMGSTRATRRDYQMSEDCN
jgi:hypothetical protein